MYEVDVLGFTIKKGDIKQEFTIEDYNYENELFLNDYTDYMSAEIVTNVSLVIYHNRNVNHLKFDLINYSVKRD